MENVVHWAREGKHYWILAAGIIAPACAWVAGKYELIKKGKEAYDRFMLWKMKRKESRELLEKLPQQVQEIKAAVGRIEEKKAASPDAKWCPNCDTRMTTNHTEMTMAGYMFKCGLCGFKAPFWLKK